MHKVVITGIGVVSPFGCDLAQFWQKNINGLSGVRRVRQFDVSPYPSQVAGEVMDFNPDAYFSKKDQRRTDLFSQYAIVAAKLACKDTASDFSKIDPYRAGVIVGSGIGGLHTFQTQYRNMLEKGPTRCSPFTIPAMIGNIAAGLIAIDFQFKGPNYAVVSACATATHAIGDALRIIQRGDADVMIAGGSDASICDLGFGGFCSLRALSTKRNNEPEQASRPFDADRDGFVMAEGAGVLILEEYEFARRRNAKIYCELSGYGATCDAYHETAPIEDGSAGAKAMTLAIEDSHENADAVEYINAHGTSTKLNDKCETLAIKAALGESHARKVMISSTKSMIGHLLGAAGAVEAAVCALALQNGVIPPTINYTTPDPDCDLDYVPNAAREKKIRFALSNSFGFGGHNATLAFRAV